MKVCVFVPDYSGKHEMVLRAFADGIPGAVVRDVRAYEPCDIAVIFGLAKKSYPATWSKKAVLERHAGRSLIVVESAFVLRGQYWNVGYGNINGHADFRTEDVTRDRWDAFGIKSRPWRRHDGPVVVCGQVPWDTNVQDTDHPLWCRNTVEHFLRRGDRVLFRPHPRVATDWRRHYDGIAADLVDSRPLPEVLTEAKCFVTWNSNSGVDAAIKGVPVIAMDRGSGAWTVANHDLASVDKLICPSRQGWLAAIGYSQWSLNEMRAGLPWKHLTR